MRQSKNGIGTGILIVGALAAALTFTACSGSDGRDGTDGTNGVDGNDGDDGDDGPPGPTVINASQVTDEFLATLDVVGEITDIEIASPPQVTFTLETSEGVPIIGIVPFWEASHSYIRFTLTKLVPGENHDPDSWVAYVRDGSSGEPDYDSGASLVDNLDGSYTFTFSTDVTDVDGVEYEPTLTHRLAGQLGSSSVSLEPQNFVHDFVPSGAPVVRTRDIAVMGSCNECHDDLVFHGRRFRVEYCVNCHNPDLAEGEGDMSFMIHKIHAAGDFALLDDAVSYAEVTYPQGLENCRKCHDGTDPATPEGDNWRTLPNLSACFGCHEEADHPGGAPPTTNSACWVCHTPEDITAVHTSANPSPNNPELLDGQVEIVYDLIDASVDGVTNEVTITAQILSDGSPLDVENLPADLATPGSYPAFLLAYALPQDGIAEPMDYNNIGQRAAQAISIGLDDFFGAGTAGTHSYDGGSGVSTFVVTDAALQFPDGATLRAVGLQGYFQQDIGGDTVSLHTPSRVVAVTGDDERRVVVDSAKCASCHEWFEGHGGNRTYNIQICTLCHVPNLSSSGRTVVNPALRDLDDALTAALAAGTLDESVDPNDPLTYPEDAQNLKDLVHAIHAAGDRDRHFQHIRGPSRQGYYDWSEVTFPRGASTSNCSLCHDGDTYALPLADDLLATTVRTTGVDDGLDLAVGDVETAFVDVPNSSDWVNTPTASSCYYCHTSVYAKAHMEQNGGMLSDPSLPLGTSWSNRGDLGPNVESCTICHGPDKVADLDVVHDR